MDGLLRVQARVARPLNAGKGRRQSDQPDRNHCNPGKQKSPHKAGFFRFLLRRLALPRGLEPLF